MFKIRDKIYYECKKFYINRIIEWKMIEKYNIIERR